MGVERVGWMRSLLVGALGGITTVGTNTRVLFCRDSFEHPVIQEHELRQDHLGKGMRAPAFTQNKFNHCFKR